MVVWNSLLIMFTEVSRFESPSLLDFQFYAQHSKNKFFLCIRLSKTFLCKNNSHARFIIIF
ncbi:hypothetical protein SAMN05216357_101159 [Porphyromonadaceae bacterium KH3CP3RA]|nr:hypothetical protein SAMN05216357_101159 [Porphyromonadaceae bacterium KH3CP3RA]